MSDLLFTEEEWAAESRRVADEMTEYLRSFRAAIYEDKGSHGEGWGSGSYLRLGDDTFILTNEHVAAVRADKRILVHQFNGQADIRRVCGDHLALGVPLDLALLPVDRSAWDDPSNASRAIEVDQISIAHDPVPTELLAFTGVAGANVSFHFDTLCTTATCYTAREVELLESDLFSSRYHFGIDYRPDLASDVIGKFGLPVPPGLSGSTVWNTNFVAAKMHGKEWTPDMARVTGVVWGWPSGYACLTATRAEYLRSFLLAARSHSIADLTTPSVPNS